MKIKLRYLWENQWYYIDFYKDNLAIKFNEFENRNKTTRLEMFTGLLDQTGNEIYEGDIIHNHKATTPSIIELDKFGFRLKQINWDSITLDQYQPKQLNIIGNIHQNQELIQGDETNEQ